MNTVLFFAALALAICGQFLLTPLGGPRAFAELPKEQAPWGFALLVVAGLAAARVVWRCEESIGDAPAAAVPVLRRPLLSAAVGLVALAVAAVLYDADSAWAIYPWAAGLTLLVAAAAVGATVPPARTSPWPPPWQGGGTTAAPRFEMLGVALVMVIAILYRLPGLESLPAQVHGDEAACGLEARRILRGEVPNLLGIGWYDIPQLSFALSALFMRVFGDDLFGLRMGSAVLGIASVPLLYGIVRGLYGAAAAFVAAFLLAVSHWHVHFSRIGTDYMQAGFAVLLVLFFFLRGRRHGRALDWVLAGSSMGLACSVYYAGRVSAVIVVVLLACDWLTDREAARRTARGATMMLLAAVLFVAPIIAVMAWSPSSLLDRSSGVFVLAPQNLEHSGAAGDERGVVRVIGMQGVRSLTAFNWRGETSEQHAHPAPLLDFWTGAVFAVGLIAFTIAAPWRPRHRVVAAWFWINLVLGSILTVDAMFSPRMIAAVPAIFVFAALTIDLYRRLASRRCGPVAAWVPVAAFLVAAAVANYADYFGLHVRELQPAGAATLLARFLGANAGGPPIYVYGTQSVRYDTARFLVPETTATDLAPDSPLPRLEPGAAALVVVDQDWVDAARVAERIAAEYPAALRSPLTLANGRIAFDVYRLENSVTR